MAPIKFEENIREKLQERELTPSKDAWSKLSAQLEEEPQKKRYPFVWFAVAASFVGVLLLVNFLATSQDGLNTNELVEEEVFIDPTLENEDLKLPVLNEQREEVSVAENTSEKPKTVKNELYQETEQFADMVIKDKIKGKDIEKKISETPLEITPYKQQVTKVASVDGKNELQKVTSQEELIKIEQGIENTAVAVEIKTNSETQFMNDKVNEVVAKVKNMQDANTAVTAEEIDALLKRAQRDISTDRILNQRGVKIDATALLQDVETQLERTFRDRVFEALGEGYSKVRTAVVERNN